jgi:alpha-N-acetylglucosaminidase
MMRAFKTCVWLLSAIGAAASSSSSSTAGVEALVKRRLPNHVNSFEFSLEPSSHGSTLANDSYTVSSTKNGKILIEGTTTSALLSG